MNKYDDLFSKENGSLYDTFLDKVIEESDRYKKERDEALKRCDELEKELLNPNRIVSIKPHSWGEYEERIEKLEQDKKVLVDGARALKTIISVVKEDDNFEYLSFPHIHIWSNDGDDRYYKIKALLELVEVEE